MKERYTYISMVGENGKANFYNTVSDGGRKRKRNGRAGQRYKEKQRKRQTSFLIPLIIRSFPREYLQLLLQIAKRDIKTETKKEEGMRFDIKMNLEILCR